jgi:hypothetical protein
LGMQVGNAFVSQYYNMLHQSPQVVHRFYTDASHLTRAEAGPDGVVDTVVTQDVCIYPPSKPSLESALFLSLYTWISISYLFSLMFSVETLVSCRKSTTRLCLWITQTSKLRSRQWTLRNP